MKRLLVSTFLFFTLLLPAACKDGTTGPVESTPPTLDPVSLVPTAAAAGDVLPLAIQVKAAGGDKMQGAVVTWKVEEGGGTMESATSKTNAQGIAQNNWTLGPVTAKNRAVATVREGQAIASVTFSVTTGSTGGEPGTGGTGTGGGGTGTGGSGASAPTIGGISPAILTPGITVTISGSNFGVAPGDNAVLVDGIPATVSAVTATQLSFTMPSRNAFRCEPTREVAVSVRTGGGTASRPHPLSVAMQHIMEVGESVRMLAASDVQCNELAQTGGRYVVSVFNTATVPSSFTAFQLRGVGAGTGSVSGYRASRSASSRRSSRGSRRPVDALLGRNRDAHLRLLRENRALAERLSRGGIRPSFDRRGSGVSRSVVPTTVGSMATLRIPQVGHVDPCNSSIPVSARVVYSGKYAVILEDTAAPLAGKMDADFRALGEEFDTRGFDLIAQNFGNPLALDATLDNNGRILMLFSPTVNSFNSAAGFTFSGDLFPSNCAASNRAEVFYATVPGVPGSPVENASDWMWGIRSTLVHELKHVTSFAERISRRPTSPAYEELWLEESTAMIAEELWARQLFGYGRNNVGYQASIACEFGSGAGCVDKPGVMIAHFGLLYEFYENLEALTPLNNGLDKEDQDVSFYGSGWSLVRWALDHSELSEAELLKALTQEPGQRGINNLEARTGKKFAEMLADWSLASATDDLPGFVPERDGLRLPSWNTREIFAKLHEEVNPSNPDFFGKPDPMAKRQIIFGTFTADVSSLRAGSASIFEISGTQGGTQFLELRSSTGEAPPPSLRIAIVRVQ